MPQGSFSNFNELIESTGFARGRGSRIDAQLRRILRKLSAAHNESDALV
jgi:hypothetical protein